MTDYSQFREGIRSKHYATKTTHRILQSPRFTILVGAEETPLTIHTALLKDLPETLNAMVNNGAIKESRSGVAVIEDVDIEVFVAFCEFAYAGDYDSTLVKYTIQKCKSDKGVVGSAEDDGDNHSNSQRTKFEVKKTRTGNDVDKREYEERIFDEWSLDLRVNFMDFYDREFQEDIRWDPSDDILGVELDFAFTVKVYVFATRYLFEPLRQYCLRYLHHQLREYKLCDFNSDPILELLDYNYASTSNEEPTRSSLMRDLVIHCVTCKFTILSRNEDFTRLLKSNAEIGSGVFLAIKKMEMQTGTQVHMLK